MENANHTLEFKKVTTYTRAQVKDALATWGVPYDPPKSGKSLLVAMPGKIAIRITKHKGDKSFVMEMAIAE
jgi:hypothetical protein